MDILHQYVCHIKRQAEQLDCYERNKTDQLLANFKPLVATESILKSCDNCLRLYQTYQEPVLYNKSFCEGCEKQKTQLALMTKQFYKIQDQLQSLVTGNALTKCKADTVQALRKRNEKLKSQLDNTVKTLAQTQLNYDQQLEEKQTQLDTSTC